MAFFILLGVLAGAIAVWAARRPWRFERLERGGTGRAVIAANLAASRKR